MSATCRGCDAPIFWATTTNGSRMPIDAEPDLADGNIRITGREFANPAAVVLGPLEVMEAIADHHDTPLYVSHFVTCPNAGEFRR